MRPVRLELDGFGSFRQPSTVDFTDADFFALVGPTGAGKSTVIDAIMFALYGSVPRWDDRRAVGWALAPTATRGVVTLVFDVGADRYVAARELRRSAQGRVTVQERPAGAAGADGPAADRRRRRGQRRGGEAARPLVRPLRAVRDPAAGRLRPVPALQPRRSARTPWSTCSASGSTARSRPGPGRRRRRPGSGPTTPRTGWRGTRTRPRRRRPPRPPGSRRSPRAGGRGRPAGAGAGRGDRGGDRGGRRGPPARPASRRCWPGCGCRAAWTT